jgi:hypothetical protein
MTDHPDFNDTTFQKHYQEHYATLSDRPYSDYQTAYRYGWDKACEGIYRGHEWGEVIERDLRLAWQQRDRAMPWLDVSKAVQEGYEQGHRSMLT